MKNVIGTFLILLLTVNCKQGESQSSAISTTSNWGADFIANEKTSLGPLAQHLVDNYPHINEHFFGPNNNADFRSDLGVFNAVRALASSMIKRVDGNGEYDVSASTPLQAWIDLAETPAQLKGVDHENLSIVMADIYESFGLSTRIVKIQGSAFAEVPDGNHTVVEVTVDGKWVAVDVRFNTLIQASGDGYASCDEALATAEKSQANDFIIYHNGYQTVPWNHMADSWYAHYNHYTPGNFNWVTFSQDYEDNLLSPTAVMTFVEYSDLNR